MADGLFSAPGFEVSLFNFHADFAFKAGDELFRNGMQKHVPTNVY